MDPVIRVVITNDRGVSRPLSLSDSSSSASNEGGSGISASSSSSSTAPGASTITLPFRRRGAGGRFYRSEENVQGSIGEDLTASESPDDNDLFRREQEGQASVQGTTAPFKRAETGREVFQDEEGVETHGPLAYAQEGAPVTTASTAAGCEAISARNDAAVGDLSSSSPGGRNAKRVFRRSASTRISSTGTSVVAAGASKFSRLPSLFYRLKQQQSASSKPSAPSSGIGGVDKAKLFLDVFASPTASSSTSSSYSERRRRLRQQSLHYATYYRGRVVSERDFDDEDDDDDRTVCTNTPVTPIRTRLPSLFGILNSNSNTSGHGQFSPRRQGRGWRRMSADDTMPDARQDNQDLSEEAADQMVPATRFLRRPHSFNTKLGQRLRSQSLQPGSGGEETSDEEAAAAVALLKNSWRGRREAGDDDAAATVSLLPSGSGAGQHRFVNHYPHYGTASNNHAAAALTHVVEEGEQSFTTFGVPVALAIPSTAGGGSARVAIGKRRSSGNQSAVTCYMRKQLHCHHRHHHDHHSHQLATPGAGWSSTSPTPPPPLGAPCTKRCCVTRMSGGSYYGSTELLNLDDSRRRSYWESAETPPRDSSVWTFGG